MEKSKRSKLLVALQMAAIAVLALSTWGRWKFSGVITMWAGLIIIAIAMLQMGIGSRLRIFPEPARDAALVQSGIYRIIRHPMYTGVLLTTLGMVLTHPFWWRWAIWVVLLVVLLQKIKLEEQLLAEKFDHFYQYARRSKKLIPFIW